VFLSFSEFVMIFDPNCQEREKWNLFVMMWIALNGYVGTLHSNWPFIGCQVCILTNEVVTCGLDFACVALDLKLDQSAINETKGTVLQLNKN